MGLAEFEKAFGSGSAPAPAPSSAKSRAVAAAPTGGDNFSPLVGGVLDTLGLTNRPGAEPSTLGKSAQMILNPQGPTEHIVSGMVTAPTIALGGAGAANLAARAGMAGSRLIPAVGRVATTGAVGAAKSAAADGNVGMDALVDTAIASAIEAIGGGAAYGLSKGAGPAKDAVKKEFADAVNAIRSRILPVTRGAGGRMASNKLVVPSLSPTPMTLDQAVKALLANQNNAQVFKQGRAELIAQLNARDALRGQVKPGAGSVLGMSTPTAPPTQLQRVAGGLEQAARSNTGRAVADTAATADVPWGDDARIPAVAFPVLGALQDTSLGGLSRSIMRSAR